MASTATTMTASVPGELSKQLAVPDETNKAETATSKLLELPDDTILSGMVPDKTENNSKSMLPDITDQNTLPEETGSKNESVLPDTTKPR